MTGKIFAAFLVILAVTCVLYSQDQVKTVSVDVEVVLIPTTVTNDRGQYVGGLEKENFAIFEDRVQQDRDQEVDDDAGPDLGGAAHDFLSSNGRVSIWLVK